MQHGRILSRLAFVAFRRMCIVDFFVVCFCLTSAVQSDLSMGLPAWCMPLGTSCNSFKKHRHSFVIDRTWTQTTLGLLLSTHVLGFFTSPLS